MSSFFTSIGKILNLKFLLIMLTVLLFLDIYFTIHLKDLLWQNYMKYIEFKIIVTIVISYLIAVNIIVPMTALMLTLFRIPFLFLPYNKFFDKLSEIFVNDELIDLENIEYQAIKDNNSALMKSYEIRLEEYKEMHTIYLFSFFLLLEIFFIITRYDDPSKNIMYEIVNFLYLKSDEKVEIRNIFLIYIPTFMLSIYSVRYITSFNIKKIEKWVNIKLDDNKINV